MQAATNAGICILANPAEGSVPRGQAELVTFSNVCGSRADYQQSEVNRIVIRMLFSLEVLC